MDKHVAIREIVKSTKVEHVVDVAMDWDDAVEWSDTKENGAPDVDQAARINLREIELPRHAPQGVTRLWAVWKCHLDVDRGQRRRDNGIRDVDRGSRCPRRVAGEGIHGVGVGRTCLARVMRGRVDLDIR